jgi:hypothetical protein
MKNQVRPADFSPCHLSSHVVTGCNNPSICLLVKVNNKGTQ